MSDDPRGGDHSKTMTGSARLLANKERILSLWEQRLRQQVAVATNERHPILIDTLPALLRQFAEAMSLEHPRRTATEGSTVAEEHGSERVRITQFRLTDVITEYRILREVVLEVLEEQEPLTRAERSIVHASLDQAIAKACMGYTLVEADLRERFSATLAHDLRTPLSAAKVNASMILRKPSSDQVPRWAARTIDSLERLDRMVQDLLDAIRVQAGGRIVLQLQECDLVEIVRQAIENLQIEHGERFVVAAPERVIGHFAPDQLKRAVENLGSNAVKYGSSSRPITITVRQMHERAFVLVHNHGGVIPAEEQESLFRVFHRSRDAEAGGKRGWGVGLAQVRGAAEAHGGSVAVDSLPERGTSFIIDIPLDARPFQSAPTTSGI